MWQRDWNVLRASREVLDALQPRGMGSWSSLPLGVSSGGEGWGEDSWYFPPVWPESMGRPLMSHLRLWPLVPHFLP